MSKHTPGPWTAAIGRFDDRICPDSDPRIFIATTGNWEAEHKAEQHANASLIAAAPELLEACVQAETLLRDGGTVPINGMAWIKLKAAIAKATQQ